MTRPCTIAGVGVLVASLVVAAPQPVMARTAAADATSIAVQADAAHEAGRLGEAAQLYARAYRAMTAEEKDALGEVMVGAALEDWHASFRSTADASHAAAAGDLLDAYERDTGRALPESLSEHRAWIQSALSPTRPRPSSADGDSATLSPIAYEADPRMPGRDVPVHKHERERDVVTPVVLGLSAGAVVSGAIMIGVGAPLGGKAARERDEALESPGFLALDPDDPKTVAYVEGYDAYVQRKTARGRALAATGSVLVAAGVGVAIYGVLRVVRSRRGDRELARVRQIPGGFAF